MSENMITFNIQAHNGNYYRGHEPSNEYGNCWACKQDDALVFTIEQARKIVKACSLLKIVISISDTPISNNQFEHELFCAKGGKWYDYENIKAKEKEKI